MRFAIDCHRLQPPGSIKAPSLVVNTDNTFGRRLSLNVSGRQCIRMDNGTEMEFCLDDVAIIDPGKSQSPLGSGVEWPSWRDRNRLSRHADRLGNH